MKSFVCLGLMVLFIASAIASELQHPKKTVCFWNSASSRRQRAPNEFGIDDIRPALSHCTHLIYGYARIHANTYEVVLLQPKIETASSDPLYLSVPRLKEAFPTLKVYLSIGGAEDAYEDNPKYLTLLEASGSRRKFINSLHNLLVNYDFDGIDLAWQFPAIKVKKNRSIVGSLRNGIKKIVGNGKFKDKKAPEHRAGFTRLVRELRADKRFELKDLTLTVLPHVNFTLYYEPQLLAPSIAAVHLMAFDQITPERNPATADLPAPIYYNSGRGREEYIDFQVDYWLEKGTPSEKIIVGIPTYARTWKITSKNQVTGRPPVVAEGPGAEGPRTQTPGFLSYGEVCSRFTQNFANSPKVSRVVDGTKKYGNYGYLSYNPKTKTDGIWIGHEDPESAATKASYVKTKSLGGIAIFDLSHDDYEGTCSGNKFPIVRAVKFNL